MTEPDPPATVRYVTPGVYTEETPRATRAISRADLSTAAFVDRFPSGPQTPTVVGSWSEFAATFGGLDAQSAASWQVRQFFLNGGAVAQIVRVNSGAPKTVPASKAGAVRLADAIAEALPNLPPFGMLCLPATTQMPPEKSATLLQAAHALCRNARALLLVDPPPLAGVPAKIDWIAGQGLAGASNAAFYVPGLLVAGVRRGAQVRIGTSGTVAGALAKTEREVGVWHVTSPGIAGASPDEAIDKAKSEVLTDNHINPIRTFPGRGVRIWGGRMLSTDPEWKYVSQLRLRLMIERSLLDGLKWTVFEPNGAALWTAIALAATNFMFDLYRDGAFPGAKKPEEAYFVRCDRSTMSAQDIDAGRCNLLVGYASAKPSEFVILKLQTMVASA